MSETQDRSYSSWFLSLGDRKIEYVNIKYFITGKTISRWLSRKVTCIHHTMSETQDRSYSSWFLLLEDRKIEYVNGQDLLTGN